MGTKKYYYIGIVTTTQTYSKCLEKHLDDFIREEDKGLVGDMTG